MDQQKKPAPWLKIGKIVVYFMAFALSIILIKDYLPVGLICSIFLIAFIIVSHKEEKKQTEETIKLNERLESLSKYQTILDVEAEAARIKSDAQKEAERLSSESSQAAVVIKANAQSEADHLLADAKDKNRSAQERLSAAQTEAGRKIDSANEEARRIIASAEEKAKAIAGEAYEIKGSVDELKQTERAIRNTIQGYGDEWLKPTYSLLDELAEEFSYTDAGKKLKDARAFSSRMVTTGTAADCDYVEPKRKETAIRFVIDAFNGKVDSILSKTRHDNYGKLERQILDAFQLVNVNGQAFRNARITPEYLDARLQELKWGVVAFELRKKEQEEQRQIREQMREEAKAQREYERAQKAAAKEEAMLKKAMEKAQAMLEKASEEQRAKFEAQLAELEQKLKEAEEKNQRAISMAQQTKHGNVYVISNVGSFGENVYKVGMTRRLEPMDRVRELGDASVPFSFDVHVIIESDDAPALEHALHKELAMMQVNKVNPRKEFFKANLSDIRALVEARGIEASWTMAAEATEYRETIAIEDRMKNDPEAQKQWSAFYERIGKELGEDDEDAG